MKRTVLFSVLGVVAGAGLGWLYWNYFGCTNGCAITSSPVNSSLYGALLGGLLVNSFAKPAKRPVPPAGTTQNAASRIH
jgi:hypothetical protein